jgi:hypothetical protein
MLYILEVIISGRIITDIILASGRPAALRGNVFVLVVIKILKKPVFSGK